MPAWVAYLVHAAAAAVAAGLVLVRRRGGDGSTLRVFEIATAVSVACALLALTSGPVFIDFEKAYLYAGQVVLTEPSRLYECTRGQCFVNIPIVALLFAPLAPLNPAVAGIIFSIAGALLLLAAVRRTARGAAADVIAWTAILSGPIYYSVRIGNTTHMLLLPLMVAFDRLAAGSQTIAGLILAAASLLKPPLAMFLPYLLLRRQLRAAVVMAACAACAVAVSIALFGVDLHAFWFREFVLRQGSRPIAAYNVQSVNGFLGHLLTRGHLRDWYPIDAGLRFRILSAGLATALVGAVTAVCWSSGPPRDEAGRRVELWLVLCLTVLVAPISWTHYDLLLLIPIAALLSRYASLDGRSRAGLVTSLVLMAPPVVVLSIQSRIGNAVYERVLVSHYFFGALLLLGVLVRERSAVTRDRGLSPARPSSA